LEEAAGRIRDKALAGEYRRALLDRFFQRRASAGRRAGPVARPIRVQRPVPAPAAAEAERCRTLLAILLRHPGLLHDVEEALGGIDLPLPLTRLRNEILTWAEQSQALDSGDLVTHLTSAGLAAEAAQALSAVPYPLPACARPDAQPAEAEAGWWHFFGLLDPGRLEREVEVARRELAARTGDAAVVAQRRLVALRTAFEALQRGEQGQDAE
jgi:DNA primase